MLKYEDKLNSIVEATLHYIEKKCKKLPVFYDHIDIHFLANGLLQLTF